MSSLVFELILRGREHAKRGYHYSREKIKGFHLYTFGVLRSLYDWVLSFAHSKHGIKALFAVSFIESSVFPIPPDPLQIALSLSKPERAFWYATLSTIASTLGGLFGYGIGMLFEPFGRFVLTALGYGDYFGVVQQMYADNVFLAVFSAALTPIPYKVFTIAGGIFGVALAPFVLASVIGRGLRFYLVALLLWIFGPKVKDFIDRYFNLLTIAFLVLIVLGFLSVKYLM